MQLFSWIRRVFASIMPSPREPAPQGHLIHWNRTFDAHASQVLYVLEIGHSTPILLGHFVVVDMQLWKKTKVPEHEFIVARVVQVKEADSRLPFVKGSELASASILIERNANNDPSAKKPAWNLLRSKPLSSKSSAASVTSTLDSVYPEPIADSHVHSMSAPDLPSAAHDYPPFSIHDATPAPQAVDDDARSSLWRSVDSRPVLRASSTSSEKLFGKPAYDRFSVHPGKSIKDITSNKGAVCMATTDFTAAKRPLLFEELAMMAKVTSDSATIYSTATSQCYWYAASIWKMVTLYTGAKPEKVDNQFRLGGLKKVLVPDYLFGVDITLQPEELLKRFLPEWDRYKANLIRLGKLRQEESDRQVQEAKKETAEARKVAEERAQEAEQQRKIAERATKLAEERDKENAELKRMLAQRDAITSA